MVPATVRILTDRSQKNKEYQDTGNAEKEKKIEFFSVSAADTSPPPFEQEAFPTVLWDVIDQPVKKFDH
ncbi:hypothetical protein KAU08_05585 [bacterium]|nr:hypothetical protein [bacterium]